MKIEITEKQARILISGIKDTLINENNHPQYADALNDLLQKLIDGN